MNIETHKKEHLEKSKNTKKEEQLPYDVRIDLFEKIMAELSRAGEKGINIEELYSSLGVNTPVGSRSLGLCKFLDFVDSDGKKTWLTENGFNFAYAATETKKQVIAQNFPKPYLIMLKWIYNAGGSMNISDIRISVVKHLKIKVSRRLLESMVTSFANICEYAGLINYIKGKGSRCELVDNGKEFISKPISLMNNSLYKDNEVANMSENIVEGLKSRIIILTEFGKFETPLLSIDDWDLAKQRLELWKKRWEDSNKINNEKSIEGKS